MQEELTQARLSRAQVIAATGGIEPALASAALSKHIDSTLAPTSWAASG